MLYKIELRKEIAARLTQARKQAGYHSAEDFCLKNKLLVNHYVACEKGEVAIKLSQALTYAALCHVSVRWLLLGDKEK